ncbi:MAG TPA: hypothetical protein VK879_07120 [Candidatus Sulfomarinibacteraceae bacterium]|nr:hypothetical protein [Candidatus Sulfomarinibacteraceae bacterium]
MPPLTRWSIRTSFLYLLAALLVGVLWALRSLISMPPVVNTLSPVYFHLFLVGWITQLIFGVVFWLFPKSEGDRPDEEPLGWLTYIFLNSGLVLRLIAEPNSAFAPGSVWGWLLVVSAVLQWLAALTFVAGTWPRVYERKPTRR